MKAESFQAPGSMFFRQDPDFSSYSWVALHIRVVNMVNVRNSIGMDGTGALYK